MLLFSLNLILSISTFFSVIGSSYSIKSLTNITISSSFSFSTNDLSIKLLLVHFINIKYTTNNAIIKKQHTIINTHIISNPSPFILTKYYSIAFILSCIKISINIFILFFQLKKALMSFFYMIKL